MKQMETILDIRDLCVEFKTAEGTVKAVNNLSYTLHKGEKLGIVGESGQWKEHLLLGNHAADSQSPGSDYKRKYPVQGQGSGDSGGKRDAENPGK